MTASSAPPSSARDERAGGIEDFSIALGGPLYQLYLKTGLAREPLKWPARRMIIIPLIVWLPLLVLSFLDGTALGNSVRIPFLLDIDVHAKYLLALPLLIASELMVHRFIPFQVKQFVNREIIQGDDINRFQRIAASMTRIRNSVVIELLLIALVYTVGHVVWRENVALHGTTWCATRTGADLQLTRAGFWYAYISAPIAQFILLRWYFRIFLWGLFLWRASRLRLNLIATHPDRAAGLGFLNAYAFGLFLFSQGVMFSGRLANRIFHDGAKLTAFYGEIAAFLVVMALLVLGPLAVFTFRIQAAKREGLREYGRLASRYVSEFDRKWLRGGAPPDEPLVGSADIQSLADMGGSFEIVQGMRLTPFGLNQIIFVVIVSAIPIMPLVLTMIPLSELLKKLVGALF